MSPIAERILVIKLRAIGDAVIATPVLISLKRHNPRARITFVTTPIAAELICGLPEADEVIAYDRKKLSSWLKLVLELRRRKFDLAVNLHASYRSALIARLSGAGERVVNNFSGHDYFSTVKYEFDKSPGSVIQRDLDCLKAIGIKPAESRTRINLMPDDESFAEELFRKQGFGSGIAVGLAIGAGRPAKCWSLEKYASLADRLTEELSARTIILSGPEETAMADAVVSMAKTKPFVLPNPSIRQTAAVISRCSLIVGNDSAAGHIAAALGTKSIVLMGPERPEEYYPYDGKRHVAVVKEVDCRVCGKYFCEDKKCLDLITVDEVLKLSKEMLKNE